MKYFQKMILPHSTKTTKLCRIDNYTFGIIYPSEMYFTIYHLGKQNDERIDVALIRDCYMSALQHLHLLVEWFHFGMKTMLPCQIKHLILSSDDKVCAKCDEIPLEEQSQWNIMIQCPNVCFKNWENAIECP